MPRDYLSASERETIGLTVVMHQRMKDLLSPWMGKKERRYLRSSLNFFGLYLKEMMARLGKEQGRKLINDFKGYSVYYDVPKSRIDDRKDELAMHLMEYVCMRCGDRARKDCTLRDSFYRYEVPVNQEDAVCEFYPKEDEENDNN